jgi:hypothetical protein
MSGKAEVCIEKVEVYCCPVCAGEYYEMDEAYFCCSGRTKTRYACPECGDFWLTEEEARACCK